MFGWTKATGGVAQVKVRGLAKVRAVFTFAILAYNLVRIPKLLGPFAMTRPRQSDGLERQTASDRIATGPRLTKCAFFSSLLERF